MANIDMFDNTLDKLFKDFSMRASKLDQWMEVGCSGENPNFRDLCDNNTFIILEKNPMQHTL